MPGFGPCGSGSCRRRWRGPRPWPPGPGGRRRGPSRSSDGLDLDAEPLPGGDRQDEAVLVARRVDPAVEHDRRGARTGGPGRVGRLAQLGQPRRRPAAAATRRRAPASPGAARPSVWSVDPQADRRRVAGIGDQGRGGHLQAGQRPPAELEAHRLSLPAAERVDLLGHRHAPISEPVDGPASPW